jgi:hypothetical protein
MSEQTDQPPTNPPNDRQTRGRWGWPILIGALAIAGVLLALADSALQTEWPQPLGGSFIARGSVVSARPLRSPEAFRFENNPTFIKSPIGLIPPLNPLQALRAFLSSGAGLVLIALAALVVFPARARKAVERLEGTHGVEIVLVAGVAMFLLTLAGAFLLRFTLIFLTVIPVLVLAVMAAALFGIACISLALGRLLHRKLRLGYVHPLVAALAGALVLFDLAVIPYAGVFVLAAFAIAGLGLAVITRFGSTTGWSFGDLNW